MKVLRIIPYTYKLHTNFRNDKNMDIHENRPTLALAPDNVLIIMVSIPTENYLTWNVDD